MTCRPARSICTCLAVLATFGCTQVPELEDHLSLDLRSAAYPDLVPLDQAVAPLPSAAAESEALEQNLSARSARLKARANALNAAAN